MPRVKKVKPPSRTQRWNTAAGEMKSAAEELVQLRDEMMEVLDERKGDQTAMERERESAGWPEQIKEAMDRYEKAADDLRAVQEEYSEWYDNMPESLQNGPTGEKLSTIQDFDITDEPDFKFDIVDGDYTLDENFDDLLSVAEEADEMELPLGFGRD